MTMLKCRSLLRRVSPTYPTKLDALAAPGLLEKHVPAAWLGRREIAGALGVFLAANAAGCRQEAATPVGSRGRLDPKAAAIVAPLFEHGRGQGESRWALACIAVASPTYLPEEEALALIRDELSKSGLVLAPQSTALDDVIIVGHELKYGFEWISNNKGREFEKVSGPLAADLVDPERQVVIEYVAHEDFDPLGGDDRASWSMDIKGVAASVGREVARQGHGVYFAAFYDPVRYYAYYDKDYAGEGDWAGTESEAQSQARQMLREQVQDFVAWLKGQGVI